MDRRTQRRTERVIIFLVIAAIGYFLIYRPIFRGRETAPAAAATGESQSESNPGTAAAGKRGAAASAKSAETAAAKEAAELLAQAKRVQESGDTDRAQKSFEELVKKYPDTWGAKQAHFELGKIYLQKGDKYAGRNSFSDALPGLDDKKRAEAIEQLNKLNDFLIFSPADTKDSTIYIVKPGDNLTRIAQKHSTTAGFIKRINNLRSDLIRVGQRLKIVSGTWRIDVYKSKFLMDVYLNGRFVKEYRVGIGRYDMTPEGEFVISVKQVNPDWYSPKGVIPFGDPRNLLGTRWLGFREKPGLTGYGIHGTKDESTIGKKSSNGCIRMANHDVEELFDMIPEGTKVFIRN